jgi:HAD superfamily hydrolase (TIGR01458 family)
VPIVTTRPARSGVVDPAAVLLDMEGVLHVGWEPLPGAVRAIEELRGQGRRLAILTNTTLATRARLAERLGAAGFALRDTDIVTAASATAAHLRHRSPDAPIHLLVEPGGEPEFDGLRLVDDPRDAEVICVGGPGEGFGHGRLEACLRALLDGAALVAMHRNRWWPTPGGPGLDAGFYVRGLEYSAGVRATVVGKPNATMYRVALRGLAAAAHEALMVGDDLAVDLAPARRLGLATCLVRTGKGARVASGPLPVDLDLPGLGALPAALGRAASR